MVQLILYSKLSVTNDVNGDAYITIVWIGWLHVDGPAYRERQPYVVGVGGPGILIIWVHRYVLGIVSSIVDGIDFYMAWGVRLWTANLNINKQ